MKTETLKNWKTIIENWQTSTGLNKTFWEVEEGKIVYGTKEMENVNFLKGN